MNLVVFFVAVWCLTATPVLFAQNVSSLGVPVNAAGVLPDLVIHRKNDLENVIYEADNSISLTQLNIETLQKALDSGDGVVINFGLEFAANTGVMTAEGNHVIDVLIGALKYVRSSTSYEILVHDQASSPSVTAASLSNTRAQSLLSRLNNRYGAKHKFGLSNERSFAKSKESSAKVDIWSFSLVSTASGSNLSRESAEER